MNKIYQLLKINRLLKSYRIKALAVLIAHNFKLRHLFVRLDPVMACNLNCRMCYFSNEDFRKSNRGLFSEVEINRIAQLLFKRTYQLVIGCSAEPTLYTNFIELIQIGKSYKIPNVCFITNGQLLTSEHIDKFVTYKLDELMLSLHGVSKNTYEKFMPGASYDQLHSVLDAVDSIRDKRKSSYPSLRLNYTVNSENLGELTQFFEIYGKYKIDALQIRNMSYLQTEYNNPVTEQQYEKFNGIIAELKIICQEKKIMLMAPILTPDTDAKNFGHFIYPLVVRVCKPGNVWKSDFDYLRETYDEYCRKNEWGKYLARCIIYGEKELIKNFTSQKVLIKYDFL